MRPRYTLTGFALLLCASFFDSLRGPLLPVFNHELGIPYEQVSLFLVVGYLSAMALGRTLIPLVERFGLGKVATTLSLLGPAAAVWAYQVSGLWTLIVFGVVVACVSALLGSTANLYVLRGTDPIYRARYFGMLHAMYGFGSLLAPLALAFVLAEHLPWRSLFVVGAIPVAALGVWIVLGLPPDSRTLHTDETRPRPFRWVSIQGLLVTAFAIYVAGEVGTSMWMVTYLVEVRGLTVAQASPYATAFFLTMTLTRLGCFFVRSDRTEALLIVGSLFAGLFALGIGLVGPWYLLPLAGLVGPYFPLVLARMSRYLPREANNLTLRILLVAQGTLAFCHFGLGYVSTHYGVKAAYHLPAVALGMAIICILLYLRKEGTLERRER